MHTIWSPSTSDGDESFDRVDNVPLYNVTAENIETAQRETAAAVPSPPLSGKSPNTEEEEESTVVHQGPLHILSSF